MAEPARKLRLHAHDQDFLAWSGEQAELLQLRNADGLDWDNLAEEIRSLGASERSEIRSRLIVVLHHLLKWQFQPGARKGGWEASILEARDQLNERLRESPSLRSYPTKVLDKQYTIARLRAADDTELPLEAFPARCHYTVAEILDEAFFPGGDS